MDDKFDLEVNVHETSPRTGGWVTSKSLCTPGCITGFMMCNEVTKGCTIRITG
ncbi:gallidermin/nisin family lantibiotic [Austwickia chelonae]|uniref:gallidermin/nisin family lantibiotic n=1 Tax=Austwickia chelonae TaxID=100225 RepID=UPI000E23A023